MAAIEAKLPRLRKVNFADLLPRGAYKLHHAQFPLAQPDPRGVLLGVLTGRTDAVTAATFEAAKSSLMSIALPLGAVMALWLGIMRLAEKSGAVERLSGFLRPLLTRLFPEVPADHPAMGAMVMNIAANMLGLGNAATPLGLKAMQGLESLNPRPGTATNAMCTFLAINTSSVQLIPATAVGIPAAAGAAHPTSIIGTALVATTCSFITGIVAVKLLQRLPMFALPPVTIHIPLPVTTDSAPESAASVTLPLWKKLLLASYVALFAGTIWHLVAAKVTGTSLPISIVQSISVVAIPFLIGFFPLYAALKGISVYEEFIEGAKEGIQVALRIFPYLVAILVAVGVFRAAGGIDILTRLSPRARPDRPATAGPSSGAGAPPERQRRHGPPRRNRESLRS